MSTSVKSETLSKVGKFRALRPINEGTPTIKLGVARQGRFGKDGLIHCAWRVLCLNGQRVSLFRQSFAAKRRNFARRSTMRTSSLLSHTPTSTTSTQWLASGTLKF